MRKVVKSVLASVLLCLMASCGKHDGSFTLQGTLQGGSGDSIIVFGLDDRFDRTDTIFPVDGRFTWSFAPDTVTTLILVLPDGRQQAVFAEKDVESTLFIPAEGDSTVLAGGQCNDAFQTFAASARTDTCLEQIYARIDSFIVNDPFSEITPYLIYEYMVRRYHADNMMINSLIAKMSGNMQDAPFLTSLKLELGNFKTGQFISSMNLTDTAGVSYDFANLGSARNWLLVCLWSSYAGPEGMQARRDMDSILTKFDGRFLEVMDISLDVNKHRWKEAVRTDTLDWFSYIDTQGLSGRIARTGDVQELPTYLIFSETKRILYKSSSKDRIEAALDSLLPAAVKPVQNGRRKPDKLKLF